METRNNSDEFTLVILKFILVALAFMAGCLLQYLESTNV